MSARLNWYDVEVPVLNEGEKKKLKVEEIEALFVYANSLQAKSKVETFEHKVSERLLKIVYQYWYL
jgi:hypothetical protein